jgi:hypothetical protein
MAFPGDSYFTGTLSKKSTNLQLADDVEKRWELWYGEMYAMRQKAEAYESYYNGKSLPLPSWAHPDAPNYFVPYIETIVDTIAAKFFLSLFAHNPIIRYRPISKDSRLATLISERLMHYYLNHRTPDFLTNLYICVVDAVLQGYGLLFMYWDKYAMAHTTTESTVEDPMLAGIVDILQNQEGATPQDLEENLTEEVYKESIQYEGFQIQPLDICDVATDINEVNQRKVPIIVREFIQPEAYFERIDSMQYPKLTEKEIESAIIQYDGSKSTDFSKSWRNDKSSSSRPKLELLHYYGKGYVSDGEDEKLQDIKLTVLRHANSDTLKEKRILQRVAIGFKPVITLRMKPAKQMFGARGVGDQCYDLQTELNVNYNSRILNTSMALHRMYVVSTTANIKDIKSLISRPGGVIEVDNIDGIKELNHTPLTPDAFNFVRETIGYMQSVTAAQDIIMGQNQRQELATTATILDNNAKQRLELHIFRMCKEFVASIGDNARTMLIKAFNPEDKVMAVLTKDEMSEYGPQLVLNGQPLVDENGFLEVQIKDLEGAMYADTEVSATDGDRKAVRQETLQLLNTVLSLNPQGMATGEKTEDGKLMVVEKLNITRVIKELFRLQGRNDVSEFIDRQLVPVPTDSNILPPKTSVGISVPFESLHPSVQARILVDSQLIKASEEKEVSNEQSQIPPKPAPGQTPSNQKGEPVGSETPPSEEEMTNMMNSMDENIAAGE